MHSCVTQRDEIMSPLYHLYRYILPRAATNGNV